MFMGQNFIQCIINCCLQIKTCIPSLQKLFNMNINPSSDSNKVDPYAYRVYTRDAPSHNICTQRRAQTGTSRHDPYAYRVYTRDAPSHNICTQRRTIRPTHICESHHIPTPQPTVPTHTYSLQDPSSIWM
jgi:hypothetical protein